MTLRGPILDAGEQIFLDRERAEDIPRLRHEPDAPAGALRTLERGDILAVMRSRRHSAGSDP